MRFEELPARFIAAFRTLVTPLIVAVLLAGVLAVVAGTAAGVAHPRDVNYPDSAVLLRVREFLRSGKVYPDFHRPPYLVTVYGPLTYILLSIPYALAQAAGLEPQIGVRLAVAGALAACVVLVFRISFRMYASRGLAWLSALFALSLSPLADWSTQSRGDFLGLAFSLLSVSFFVSADRRFKGVAAAIAAALAILIKPTFWAAPAAILCGQIYERGWKPAILWAAGFATWLLAGFGFAAWREPSMLEHVAALSHPVLEFGQAWRIFLTALSQPVTVFGALGALLALQNPAPVRIPYTAYCVFAWLVAVLTIPHAGGNINYFWEPLLASSPLAAGALDALRRNLSRAPPVVLGILLLLVAKSFAPALSSSVNTVRRAWRQVASNAERRAQWDAFVAVLSGRRLLSTLPEVTLHAALPEIPDPYFNTSLERSGRWDYAPFAARIDARAYEFIVVRKGEAAGGGGHRGIPLWSAGMWNAIRRNYRLGCSFDDIEVWLPFGESSGMLLKLAAAGCRAPEPGPDAFATLKAYA